MAHVWSKFLVCVAGLIIFGFAAATASARNPCRAARQAAIGFPPECAERTCSDQRGSCITFRRDSGPGGSEGVCDTAFKACLKTGVWDGTVVFPYGGTRVPGLIRR
jgi:hypothetical protein